MLAVRRILEEAGRDLTQERVGFLGLGSIGTSSLQMLLSCLPHPAEILLCDVYSKREALSALRRQLVESLGYCGSVRTLEARGGVPAGLYEASLLIGATNVPDILDVDRLAPGTLLVDDSNPHCFRLDRAIRRLRERQDLLFTEGGMLRAATPLGHVIYIPEELEQTARDLPADLFANYDPHHVMGCVLSGLLSARRPDLPPTVGLAVLRACQAHYEAVTSLGFRAPALHGENYALEEGAIRNFRRHFGRRIDAPESAATTGGVEEAPR
jgi:hypothetical protein